MKAGSVLIGLALGTLIGLAVGFFVGSHVSEENGSRIAYQTAMAERVSVICSASDLPPGHIISRSDLYCQQVFEHVIPAHRRILPADASLILGRKLLFSLKRGRPIEWSDIEGGRTRLPEAEGNQRPPKD